MWRRNKGAAKEGSSQLERLGSLNGPQTDQKLVPIFLVNKKDIHTFIYIYIYIYICIHIYIYIYICIHVFLARIHSPPEASSSFCSAQTSRQGPLYPTLRANPFPKVTDLFCRLPLPTLLYRPEATNLSLEKTTPSFNNFWGVLIVNPKDGW